MKASRHAAVHRRYAAVHESGHATATWLLGSEPESLQLPSAAGQAMVDSRGRSVMADGLCEGGHRYNPGILLGMPPAYAVDLGMPEVLANTRILGLAAAAVCIGGPLAEARCRRQSLGLIVLNGGRDDWDQCRSIAADLWPDERSRRGFLRIAEALSIRLFRGRMPAIYALAGELDAAGQLDEERLRSLLVGLFGPMPEENVFASLGGLLCAS